MPKVRVADIDIYYETHGDGEPLVLIMGLGGGSSLWWRQAAFFSREYRVVVYDSRGVGRSDKPDTPYSVGIMVDDAAGLMESLGITSAHVYGVSMGGMAAQELALRYPKQVSSLILGATTCGGSHALMPSREILRKLFGIMNLSRGEAVKVSTSVTFSTGFIERHPRKIREWLIKGTESLPSPMGFRRQAEATTGFDTYDTLRQISAPSLIIAGTADQLIPPENSTILASGIPDAKLVLFEGAGHGYLWEAEEEANRVVWDFLHQHPMQNWRRCK